ncbi:MAG: VWA domain-containing protein [Pyrinomonadaceae bacterium]
MIRERVRIVGLVILSLVAAGASSPAPPQTTATGAADAHRESADVWFSVEDRNGQCAPTLGAEDLRVSEDGAAQQIRSFAFRRDSPRAIVIAVDNSMSQADILPSVKRVAQALVAALARPGRDTVAVLSFADEATLEQNFTADAARAEKAVADIYVANPEAAYIGGILIGNQNKQKKQPGSTSLQDALWLVGGEVFAEAPKDARRVLVLITDGRENSSEVKKREAMNALLGAGAVIYAIGAGDAKSYEGVDRKALKDLTERTGGHAYFPVKDPEVREVFTEIRQSLDCQSFLSYAPANRDATKSVRKLKIEIANPALRAQALRVNYPEAYVFGRLPEPPPRRK